MTTTTRAILTDTQLTIVQMIADGAANKQVATDLALTETSIKKRLRVMFRRTGTVSRAHLVALCLRRRLID